VTRFVEVRLLWLLATHQNPGRHTIVFYSSRQGSERNQAALNCNSYRVCSILGPELVDEILDMEIDGCFRNCQVIRDFFVAVSVANESKNLQFSTRKILVAQVLRDTGGNFVWNVAFAGVN
jgi:hypothetical protein